MQANSITSSIDLRGNKVPDKKTVGDEVASVSPVIGVNNETGFSQTTNPASNAALQREAALAGRSGIAEQIIQSIATRGDLKLYSSPLPLDPKGSFIILVTGPYGAGKDSVLKKLVENNSIRLAMPVRYTSREIRVGEKEGVDYYFISKETADQMIASGEFLLCGELANGCDYATGIKSVQTAFDERYIPGLIEGDDEIDAMKNILKDRNISYIEIFVSPLSKEELMFPGGIDKALEILKGRMIRRGTTGVEQRLQKSKVLLEHIPEEAKVVKNQNEKLDEAVDQAKKLIKGKQEEIRLNELAKKSPQLKFEATGEILDIKLDPEKFKANKNIVIILTGPSGAGKDTLLNHIRASELLDIAELLSHTTRPMRKDEQQGKNYFYVSQGEFEQLIAKKELVEWVMVHNGHFFGKEINYVQENLDSGKDLILALNVSGANYYKHLFSKLGIPCVDIFLSPVPKELLDDSAGIEKAISILKERIRNRNSGETEAQIQDRLNIAREWLKEAKKYSHIVENTDGNLKKAVSDFVGIVRAKKVTAYASLGLYSEVIAPLMK